MEVSTTEQPKAPSEAVEVEYEDALAEEGTDQQAPMPGGAAPAPDPEEPRPSEESPLKVLAPHPNVKSWTIGKGENSRTYIQRPMSFLGKMQWFSLLGEVLDTAMGGENPLTVNNLLSAPQRPTGQLRAEDFRDADTFVHAVGKLLVHAPDFLTKSFCIWLSVPDYEREIASMLMELPPEDGGLSDDDGLGIIEVFIDQNYEALDNFFREKMPGLQNRVRDRQQEINRARAQRQSKR